MDKLREEFEVWVQSKKPYWLKRMNWREELQCYDYEPICSSWEAWKASRAALVVQLPSKCGHLNMINGRVIPEAENYDEAIDDCADAIRDEGISIKGEE